METAIRSTSPSGRMTIEIVDGQGLIGPIDRPLVPRLRGVERIAINDDASIVAYVDGGIVHDLSVFVLKGNEWVLVFSKRLIHELVTEIAWKTVAPPEMLVTTNKGCYIVYEWSSGWHIKPNK